MSIMARVLVGSALVVAVGGVIGSAGAGMTQWMTDYNLIVFGNASNSSNVHGRTLIGGNLSTQSSDYGIQLTPASNYLGVDVLTVGGNITAQNINLNAGNLRLGGTRTGNLNLNGGGVQVNDVNSASIANTARTELLQVSALMKNRAATNTVALPGGSPAPVTFNCVAGGDGVAVFNIAGSALFGNSNVQQIDIALNGATTVVINVTGQNIGWSMGNFVGAFTSLAARTRVIWNFHEALSLNWLNGGSLNGSVLAPNAHLAFGSVIEGSVAVNTIDQRSEVHRPGYQGLLPSPGTAALLALGGLVASRRRR